MDELEFEALEEMTEEEFAEALGFDSYESLMQASESVVSEGYIDWYVTALPDGRWAAWDDAELSMDRVEFFDTREEAVEFHLDAFGCILVLDDYLTQYSGREAVRLPWNVVENLIGDYDDTEEDDNQLIAALREMPTAKGRPKWLDDPATRRVVTDDAGWWLVGPRVEE